MKPSELLSTPEKWTKGVGARDARGHQVSFKDPDARCFCITSALCICATKPGQYESWMTAIGEKIGSHDGYGVIQWNDADARTYEDVKRVLLECEL